VPRIEIRSHVDNVRADRVFGSFENSEIENKYLPAVSVFVPIAPVPDLGVRFGGGRMSGVGLPVAFAVAIAALVLIPNIWPFALL
jgi:hypothetical protein